MPVCSRMLFMTVIGDQNHVSGLVESSTAIMAGCNTRADCRRDRNSRTLSYVDGFSSRRLDSRISQAGQSAIVERISKTIHETLKGTELSIMLRGLNRGHGSLQPLLAIAAIKVYPQFTRKRTRDRNFNLDRGQNNYSPDFSLKEKKPHEFRLPTGDSSKPHVSRSVVLSIRNICHAC